MNQCSIIGISDKREQWFPPEVTEVIANGKVFSGGKRHHEIMSHRLPEGSEWIDITVPLSDVFRQYEAHDDVVIFASGDPLFFGFANTVQRELPDCTIKVFPSFNSLQMLAHRMCLPYHDMHVVSLTGRPWNKFDEALINGEELIGILTDRKKTPEAIMQRMLDYGYDNYTMTIGENLGNESTEKITTLNLQQSPLNFQLSTFNFQLNCIILQRTYQRPRPFGIPESDFALLDGRAKMITKMPIRLLTLSMLDLRHRHTFWDIGFCTGSVSIEAKLQFPHLDITAFEIREEGRELMAKNTRRFGTPGIKTIIGDFMEIDLPTLLSTNTHDPSSLKTYLSPPPGEGQGGEASPDAVFIGGHGGKLKEMLHKIYPLLNDNGVIVMNSVTEASRTMFIEACNELGMTLYNPLVSPLSSPAPPGLTIALDSFNPITILKATK